MHIRACQNVSFGNGRRKSVKKKTNAPAGYCERKRKIHLQPVKHQTPDKICSITPAGISIYINGILSFLEIIGCVHTWGLSCNCCLLLYNSDFNSRCKVFPYWLHFPWVPVTYLTVTSLLNSALLSGIHSYSVRFQRGNLRHHQFKVSCGKDYSKIGNCSVQMEEICFPELASPWGSFAFSFPVCSVWESSVCLAQPLV